VLKLITLLRPDYRQVGHSMTAPASILIVVQTLLALIVPLWVALRLMLRHQVGVFDGIWAIPIVAILLLAVVLAAGDPRYRLSIEVLAIIDAAWCYDAWSRRGRAMYPEFR
jgi:steroid 5-alpha reductase family enzyme